MVIGGTLRWMTLLPGAKRGPEMNTMRCGRSCRGFTLVELLAVVVVLAILSGIAVPRYFDYSAHMREDSCRASLEAMRTAIAHFHAMSEAEGKPRWPTLVEIRTVGVVFPEKPPVNPYLSSANNNSLIIAGTWPLTGAPPVESTPTGGWCYDVNSGRIWANSATIPAKAPGGPENTW
jgi:prepilin-type N-terminal cleavage/methylation domain-containing protein